MKSRRSLILETSAEALFHTALLFSVFLLFTGHNSPGGGFAGGLVAGAAFIVRFVDAGAEEVARVAPAAPQTVIGLGLALALLSGAAGWLIGTQFLESGKHVLDLPVLGSVPVSSSLVFDVGVYFVVVGLVLGVLRTLGADAEREGEA